VAGRLKNKSLC